MNDPAPNAETPPRAPSEARAGAGRILRNARALIGGKAYGGVLSLAYLGIAARSLGPTEMGYLVLAHAYVLLIARVARFQSWQAVIRFGAPMIAEDDAGSFKTLIRYTLKLDLLSACVAVGGALALLGLVSGLMGWPEDAMPFIYAYCFAAPFLMAATPTGVLRLFDRFKTLSWQLAIMPTIRFVGAASVWATGGGLTGFLIVWIIGAVAHGLSLWFLGWRELRRRNLVPPAAPAPGERAPSHWLPFMIKTNLSSTIDQTQTTLPVLIVGAVLGGAASGFLQLAVNLSNLIAHPANMLYQAAFPELARLQASGGAKEMRAAALRAFFMAALVASPLVAGYVVFGGRLAQLIGGPAFAAAGVLVGLMAFSQIWRIGSLILESSVLALGRAGYVLGAQVASALVHLATLAVLLPAIGVVGAPIAIMASWAALVLAYLTRLFRTSA